MLPRRPREDPTDSRRRTGSRIGAEGLGVAGNAGRSPVTSRRLRTVGMGLRPKPRQGSALDPTTRGASAARKARRRWSQQAPKTAVQRASTTAQTTPMSQSARVTGNGHADHRRSPDALSLYARRCAASPRPGGKVGADASDGSRLDPSSRPGVTLRGRRVRGWGKGHRPVAFFQCTRSECRLKPRPTDAGDVRCWPPGGRREEGLGDRGWWPERVARRRSRGGQGAEAHPFSSVSSNCKCKCNLTLSLTAQRASGS